MTHTRRPARSLRNLLIGAVAATVAVAGLTLAPTAATAASTYTVSGTVSYDVAGGGTTTNKTSYVLLQPLTGSTPRQPLSGNAVNGTWSVPGVAPGRYRVQFRPSDDGANAGTWIGSTFEDSATVVTVTTANVSGLTATQPVAGSISGTVTGATVAGGIRAYRVNPTTMLLEGFNEAPTTLGLGGVYSIGGLAPGEYRVRFADANADQPNFSTSYYDNADSLGSSTPITVTAGQQVTGINGSVGAWSWYGGRIAGADRFDTSVQIALGAYSAGQASVVYVANGVNFPDALGASAAAARAGGPLLMTRQDFVPASVVNAIKTLAPPKIVVVGGLAAVGASAFAQLQKLAPTVTRVSGDDRFATSRAVAGAFTGQHVNSVFIATGNSFPDALVAGSAAGYQGGPLLLVNGWSSSLDAATKSLITSLSPLRIYIAGGVNSVSSGIQRDLQNLGVPTVLRLAGNDRFGTAQAVNNEIFPLADTAFVASGLGFPDALSISAIAGAIGAPLLLAVPECIPYGEFRDATLQGVATYWAVGGTSVLSFDIEHQITYCQPGLYGSSAGLGSASAETSKPVTPITLDPKKLNAAITAGRDKH
ncbi:cell wall-binding repeat-containing protein [Leifsonia sp. NCR5]|uniref:cell wall-binding repeat-containing protein n=1 Tax=Leifsonia sp. NCR5 TaxID=1978342 RepID=UPI000A197510|nr:cell wall-binding repeat-containing protein [Leifsonia sp. NCR5]